MNEISVKIVESPKVVEVAESPVPEPGDNDVDPLAIEDDAGKVKEPPVDDQATSCDENAKEEIPSGSQNDESENLALQTEKVKAELLKEDSSSINSATEESVEADPSPSTINDARSTVPTPEPEPVQDSVSTVTEEPQAHLTTNTLQVALEPVVEEPTPPAPVKVKEVISEKAPSPASEPMEVVPEEKPVVEYIKEVVKPVEEKTPVVEKEVKVETVEEKVVKEQKETKPKVQPVNGDISKSKCKEEQATKRRACDEVDTESPLKKLCQEVEKTFPQHDIMINDYIQNATKNNIDEIQRHTEQLLAEIQTLRELAQKKEHEWNNILHLKKVKEEILLRLLRRKQVLSFEKAAEINGSDRTDPFDYLNQAKNLAIDKSDEISGLAIKQPGSTVSPMIQAPVMPVTSHFNPLSGLPPPYDKAAHMQMPKPVFQPMMMPGPMPGFPRDMNMNGQLPTSFGMPMGRQGPTKDVKSIIADYRQRNPEVTPRRGRRMKSILNPGMMNAPRPIAPKGMDSLNNMSNLNNLNMLFNNLDMNQKAMLERLQQIQAGGLPNSIFKDALVQFANMQQANAGLLPNRPTETITNRPEHHVKERRRPERNHEEHINKQPERMPSTSPRLPPPPPYPEISLLPVTTSQETQSSQQNSLLHGILTKPAPSQSFSPTLAKLLTSPERKQSASAPQLPSFGQAKNCGEITITPVQPAPAPEPQPEKTEEVVQLDDEESPAASEGSTSVSPVGSGSGSGRLVIDEGGAEADAPLCQGCRRRDAQFVCAGCANQWYCSRDCQVAAWDEHSEMCSG